ncbi:IclR family transcriptional regulator domain-containing protein [Bradyrhizobium uaiense]|uniref:IclR family transcriptional regulator domain-containing protein n=1 Tax=Bradyrhizobium uaiense TaxID=2594946 RepID=UPI003D312B84
MQSVAPQLDALLGRRRRDWLTDNTIVDCDTLLRLLEETRRQGWAKTNEEYVKGVVGCGVPIVSPDRQLIACLGVSVPAARVSFVELDRFIPPLQRAAVLLSQTILQTDSEDATLEEI